MHIIYNVAREPFFLSWFGSRVQKVAHHISKNIASIDLDFQAEASSIHHITVVTGNA